MTEPDRDDIQAQLQVILDDAERERAAAAATSPVAASAMRREGLDRAEREIKDEVLRMGSLVAAQIEAAISALAAHDYDAATAVIVGDVRINEAQRHVSSLIQTAIATQGPVARDLRFLLSLDHVTYELERMGDHGSSVAKQAQKLAPQPPLAPYDDLLRMGGLAADQVRKVLRALVDLDVSAARVVAAVDDDIDDLYHKIFADVVELMRADPGNVERGTSILFAARTTSSASATG